MVINYKEKYQQLYGYLRKIFSEQQLMQHVNDNEFNKILQDSLNLLISLSVEVKQKNNSENDIINKFNELSKNKLIKEKIAIKNIDNVIDKINYIRVFVNNSYNYDLLTNKQVNNAEIINNDTNNFVQNNINPKITNQIVANIKLQQDIASGNIYIFKTKPKYIPLIKWIAISALILLTLGVIFCSIGFFSLSAGEGILYIGIAICNMFMIRSNMMQMLPTKRTNNKINDNLKFYFAWPTFLIYTILMLVIITMDLLSKVNDNNVDTPLIKYLLEDISNPQFVVLLVGEFMGLAMCAVLLICIIIGSVLNPKRDTEKINNFINASDSTTFEQTINSFESKNEKKDTKANKKS